MIYLFDSISEEYLFPYWRDIAVPMLELAGERVEIIKVDFDLKYRKLGKFSSDYVYKNAQFPIVVDKLMSGDIQHNDIFLFLDLNNTFILPLYLIFNEFKIRPKFVAFHTPNTYDFIGTAQGKSSIFNKHFFKHYVRLTRYLYDKHCFSDRTAFLEFKSRCFKSSKIHNTRECITGFPFSGIRSVVESLGDVEKEDLIVFKSITYDTEVNTHIGVLEGEFQRIGYKTMNLNEVQFSYREYLHVLKRSRAIVSLNKYTTFPIHYYEALLCNTIPIFGSLRGIKEVVPEHYRFPKRWYNENKLSFFNNVLRIVDFIKNQLESYDVNRKRFEDDLQNVEEKYFNDAKFLNFIK